MVNKIPTAADQQEISNYIAQILEREGLDHADLSPTDRNALFEISLNFDRARAEAIQGLHAGLGPIA